MPVSKLNSPAGKDSRFRHYMPIEEAQALMRHLEATSSTTTNPLVLQVYFKLRKWELSVQAGQNKVAYNTKPSGSTVGTVGYPIIPTQVSVGGTIVTVSNKMTLEQKYAWIDTLPPEQQTEELKKLESESAAQFAAAQELALGRGKNKTLSMNEVYSETNPEPKDTALFDSLSKYSDSLDSDSI